MKWVNQIKQMRWWMFLPFGQLNMMAAKWVMDAEIGDDRVIRNIILTVTGIITTVPAFLWLCNLVFPFK
jgi:hypothetical protein